MILLSMSRASFAWRARGIVPLQIRQTFAFRCEAWNLMAGRDYPRERNEIFSAFDWTGQDSPLSLNAISQMYGTTDYFVLG
jgi:hypothetical protein